MRLAFCRMLFFLGVNMSRETSVAHSQFRCSAPITPSCS
jgi:hypothetical protein